MSVAGTIVGIVSFAVSEHLPWAWLTIGALLLLVVSLSTELWNVQRAPGPDRDLDHPDKELVERVQVVVGRLLAELELDRATIEAARTQGGFVISQLSTQAWIDGKDSLAGTDAHQPTRIAYRHIALRSGQQTDWGQADQAIAAIRAAESALEPHAT